MKLWPFGKSEHRAADYGAALAVAFETLAGGSVTDAAQTAAAEFAIGLMGRAFAVADVTGVNIGPQTLEAIGRNMGLRGNAVFDVRADPASGLTLIPAASWDIAGSADPATWTYALHLPGPSNDSSVIRNGADVIHCRINALPESAWAGRSPLLAAGFSAKLIANVELRAGEEANSQVGRLLSTPPLNDASKTGLRADLKALKGKVAIVENGGGNFGRQAQGGPSRDWQTSRFGADFPEGNVKLRRDAAADVVSSFGIPGGLFLNTEGAAVRESWRQFGVTCDAWGEIVGAELTDKLERPVSLSFRRLASIDVAARARALGILVQDGMALNDALDRVDLED